MSQTQKSNTQFRPFTDLTFEIDVPVKTLLPLQPIPVILRQSNRTDRTILGYRSISFTSPLNLYVRKGEGDKWVQISPLNTIHGLIGHTNSEVLPDTISEKKEWISLNPNKYFSEPGTYEIRAILANADGTQTVESNNVVIEIQEPTGIDRDVHNLIKNNPAAAYLFSDAEFDKKKSLLELITNQYSNSGYAKNAFYTIGERYLVRKQYASALTNLSKLENDNDFIFADKVKNYLTELRRLPRNN